MQYYNLVDNTTPIAKVKGFPIQAQGSAKWQAGLLHVVSAVVMHLKMLSRSYRF